MDGDYVLAYCMTKYDLDHEMINRDEDPNWEIREYSTTEIQDIKINWLLTGAVGGFMLGIATGVIFVVH